MHIVVIRFLRLDPMDHVRAVCPSVFLSLSNRLYNQIYEMKTRII